MASKGVQIYLTLNSPTWPTSVRVDCFVRRCSDKDRSVLLMEVAPNSVYGNGVGLASQVGGSTRRCICGTCRQEKTHYINACTCKRKMSTGNNCQWKMRSWHDMCCHWHVASRLALHVVCLSLSLPQTSSFASSHMSRTRDMDDPFSSRLQLPTKP